MRKRPKYLIDIKSRFNRLTVISNVIKPKQGVYNYVCRCDCGNLRLVNAFALLDGRSQACGCLQKQVVAKINTTHGASIDCASKGLPKEYTTWVSMRQRCNNNKSPSFLDYGGRGITVCERWDSSFENFLADMGPAPSKKHSIDRIDVNGNYEPSNCRWADWYTQACNTRKFKGFLVNGEILSLGEIGRRIGKFHSFVSYRMKSQNKTAQQVYDEFANNR